MDHAAQCLEVVPGLLDRYDIEPGDYLGYAQKRGQVAFGRILLCELPLLGEVTEGVYVQVAIRRLQSSALAGTPFSTSSSRQSCWTPAGVIVMMFRGRGWTQVSSVTSAWGACSLISCTACSQSCLER